MGMRHQIFVIIPKDFRQKPSKTNRVVVALHEQWLYGRRAVQQALRLMTSLKAHHQPVSENRSSPSWGAFDAYRRPDLILTSLATAIYGTDPDDNTFIPISNLGEEDSKVLRDPRRVDNNTGITIIDGRDFANIKYAFCVLSDDRRDFLDEHDKIAFAFQPMDALQYIRRDYPLNPKSYWRGGREGSGPKRGRTLNLTIGAVESQVRSLTRKMSQFGLLTRADIFDLFPALKPPVDVEAEYQHQMAAVA